MSGPHHHPFSFHGARLIARADGALHWPCQDTLIVADLHLGKPERLARRGGALIPPYGDAETLARLTRALHETGAVRVIVLGDGFDDPQARLADDDCTALGALTAGREWIWVAGNHDPSGARNVARFGKQIGKMVLGPLRLRHNAQAGIAAGVGSEHVISGHFHPAVRLAGRRRPAFLIGTQHLILPAFGAYTGGLDADDPALMALVPRGQAVLTGPRALVVPWPLPAPRARRRVG